MVHQKVKAILKLHDEKSRVAESTHIHGWRILNHAYHTILMSSDREQQGQGYGRCTQRLQHGVLQSPWWAFYVQRQSNWRLSIAVSSVGIKHHELKKTG